MIALIFDMDGTILDTEPTHRKAWRQVLSRYGLAFDEARVTAFNGAPSWQLAKFIIETNNSDRDPYLLAAEKTAAVKAMLEGPCSAACPASLLQKHPHGNVFLDDAVAGALKDRRKTE